VAEATIIVTLEDQNEAALRERVAIVAEYIRSGMFGCNAPDSPDAWKFRIRLEGEGTRHL
jgi:hypothetical protein